MQHYRLWVRTSPSHTTYTYISAENDIAARQIGEAMFGRVNLLAFWRA
ncbi:hypothetical protein [Novosphingobium fuchskuhlense]|nr:hypothetical protein [Novosphingobium fuchskuhlense]